MTGSPVHGSALAGCQFLRGLPEAQLGTLASAAVLVSVPAGHEFFRVGAVARQFWVIRVGQVALDVDAPGGGTLTVETLGRGELVGLSWFLPPYQWQYGARAVQRTEAFEFDAAQVRRVCDEDPALGYQLTRRLFRAAAARLQATRTRMLDLSTQLAARA